MTVRNAHLCLFGLLCSELHHYVDKAVARQNEKESDADVAPSVYFARKVQSCQVFRTLLENAVFANICSGLVSKILSVDAVAMNQWLCKLLTGFVR
jgi:hypothetical protein